MLLARPFVRIKDLSRVAAPRLSIGLRGTCIGSPYP